MSCSVTLRDTALATVTAGAIDIIAFDPGASVRRSTVANGPLGGGEYGANLTTATGDLFDIIVDTTATNYAPPTLETFTDTGNGRVVDVVLYLLPPAGSSSGTPPASCAQVSEFVNNQSWAFYEKSAAFVTMTTLRYVKRSFSTAFGGIEDRLNGIVSRVLGINPSLVV